MLWGMTFFTEVAGKLWARSQMTLGTSELMSWIILLTPHPDQVNIWSRPSPDHILHKALSRSRDQIFTCLGCIVWIHSIRVTPAVGSGLPKHLEATG